MSNLINLLSKKVGVSMNLNKIFNENGHVQISKNNDFANFLSDLASEVKIILPDF